MIPLAELVLDPANARKHSPKNLEAIKGSLAKFGQQKPIVVGKGNVVVAGNGTLEAARALGWEKIAAVRTKLEGPEAIAFALADNRTAELAEWDFDVLGPALAGLKEIDFDIGAIGFDDSMLPTRAPSEGLTDPDEIPEDAPPRCKPGDLWVLGAHRLLCGDSTDVLAVERLMAGEKASMVYTDPPYGMRLNADYSAIKGSAKAKIKGRGGKKYAPVIGDDQDFDPATIFGVFSYCSEVFLWGADYYADKLIDRNEGFWIVWDKRGSEDADKIVGASFELCWSKAKHKRDIARIKWMGAFGYADARERVHPTQKPIALHEWFFERWGKPADLVADLFLGSGSTLIACEKTGRRCFGMEIDPKYCDVILARWEAFTGKTAALAS